MKCYALPASAADDAVADEFDATTEQEARARVQSMCDSVGQEFDLWMDDGGER